MSPARRQNSSARGRVGELGLAQLAGPQQEARHQRPVAAAAAAIDDRLDARERLVAHVQARRQLARLAAQLRIVGAQLQRLQRRLDRALALPQLLAQLGDLAVRLGLILGRGRRGDALLQHHRQRRQLILIAQAHAQAAELGGVAHRLHHRRVHELAACPSSPRADARSRRRKQHVDHREAHALRLAAARERQQRAPGPLGALVVRGLAGRREQLLQHQRVAEIDRRRLLEHADRLAVAVLRAPHAAELEQDLRALRRAARAGQRLLQRRARLIGAAGRQQRRRQREHDRLVLRRGAMRALERGHRDRRFAERAGRQRVDLVGDRDQRRRILGVGRRLGEQRRQRRRRARAAVQIDERGAHGLRRRRLDQRALEASDRAVAAIDRQVGLRQAQRHLWAIGGGRDLEQLIEPRGRRLGLAALHAQAPERIQRRRRGHQRRRALVRRDGARAVAERALGDAAEPAPQRGGLGTLAQVLDLLGLDAQHVGQLAVAVGRAEHVGERVDGGHVARRLVEVRHQQAHAIARAFDRGADALELEAQRAVDRRAARRAPAARGATRPARRSALRRRTASPGARSRPPRWDPRRRSRPARGSPPGDRPGARPPAPRRAGGSAAPARPRRRAARRRAGRCRTRCGSRARCPRCTGGARSRRRPAPPRRRRCACRLGARSGAPALADSRISARRDRASARAASRPVSSGSARSRAHSVAS